MWVNMIKYLNGEDYPIEKNKFEVFFQGPSNFAKILNKMFPCSTIYLKYTYPDSGRIYLNSWRAREFLCNIIPEKYFMCFASYDGETLPPFIGDPDVREWNGNNRVTPRTFDKRRLYL